MKYLNDTGVEHLLHGEWENMIDFIFNELFNAENEY